MICGMSTPEQRAAFVERLGGALTAAGLARLPSRIFAAVLVDDDGRMTAAEIGETLGVSPAAVSGAVKYLDGVGMVRRERERGSRRDVFVVDDEAWHDTLLQADSIYAPMIAALERGIDDLGADDPAHQRLAVSRAFMQFVLDELHGINERWVAHRRSIGLDEEPPPK
jgi:DNA-binding transcriptional regulator GbsR (MarR family)